MEISLKYFSEYENVYYHLSTVTLLLQKHHSFGCRDLPVVSVDPQSTTESTSIYFLVAWFIKKKEEYTIALGKQQNPYE